MSHPAQFVHSSNPAQQNQALIRPQGQIFSISGEVTDIRSGSIKIAGYHIMLDPRVTRSFRVEGIPKTGYLAKAEGSVHGNLLYARWLRVVDPAQRGAEKLLCSPGAVSFGQITILPDQKIEIEAEGTIFHILEFLKGTLGTLNRAL